MPRGEGGEHPRARPPAPRGGGCTQPVTAAGGRGAGSPTGGLPPMMWPLAAKCLPPACGRHCGRARFTVARRDAGHCLATYQAGAGAVGETRQRFNAAASALADFRRTRRMHGCGGDLRTR